MRESLRLSPTATVRTVTPLEDTFIIGGDGDPSNPANKKYEVKKGVPILAHIHVTHLDPRVYGEDAHLFRPERMLDGKFEKLPVSLLFISDISFLADNSCRTKLGNHLGSAYVAVLCVALDIPQPN